MTVYLTDALTPPNEIVDESVILMWTDPPYGTKKVQSQGGKSYKDYGTADLTLSALRAWDQKMHANATICICMDYRLIHQVIAGFGWQFRGEIIWTFGLGRPRTSWWPNRHNTVATFTRTMDSGLFDSSAVPRERRLAPKDGYQSDKPSGSVWDFTMSNTHPDRQGYPNQKPIELIMPFIFAHTLAGDLVADPFMGSGSVGVAAQRANRQFVGTDNNPESLRTASAWLREGLL